MAVDPTVPSSLSVEWFAQRLAAHRPHEVSRVLHPRRAAVAAVLRFDRGRPEVLLMKRAEHPEDRWSGHVSMPGGREEDGDSDLLTTAIRETREELGLDLSAPVSRLLGRLDDVRAIAKGKVLPMSIHPFVFHHSGEPELVLSEEAEAAFWFPLDRAASGELSGDYPYRMGPARITLPCWRWEGYTVWGLTHTMLSSLLTLVAG